MPLEVTLRLRIPDDELEFTFVRSSGPGGQNVNKVNSKAQLRWNAVTSRAIPEDMRERVFAALANKLTAEGEILVASDRFRDQGRNREDCLEKLRELMRAASHIPKSRKKTKPSRSSQRRTRDSKTRQSEKKALRKVRF